jgi:hypothetical protein
MHSSLSSCPCLSLLFLSPLIPSSLSFLSPLAPTNVGLPDHMHTAAPRLLPDGGFLMDEFIETTWLAVASPSYLPPSALYQPREEKERNQNTCRCFFSKIKNHTENRYVD